MATPRPIAARADVVTWAATAAIAVKTMPLDAHPSPKATAPGAGSPTSPNPRATPVPSTALAPMPTATAAASGAARPTAPACTSSSRPDSSSERLWRTVMNTNRIDTSAAPKAVILISDTAPSDVGSYTLP